MLRLTGCTPVVAALRELAPSPVPSQVWLVLSVDDTMIDRWGRVLSLTHS